MANLIRVKIQRNAKPVVGVDYIGRCIEVGKVGKVVFLSGDPGSVGLKEGDIWLCSVLKEEPRYIIAALERPLVLLVDYKCPSCGKVSTSEKTFGENEEPRREFSEICVKCMLEMEKLWTSAVKSLYFALPLPKNIPDDILLEAKSFLSQVYEQPYFLTPDEIEMLIMSVPPPPPYPQDLPRRKKIVTRRSESPPPADKEVKNPRRATWTDSDYVYRRSPTNPNEIERVWIDVKVDGWEWEEEYEVLTEEGERMVEEWSNEAREWWSNLSIEQQIAVLAYVSHPCPCGYPRPHICLSSSLIARTYPKEALILYFDPHEPRPVWVLLKDLKDHGDIVARAFQKKND